MQLNTRWLVLKSSYFAAEDGEALYSQQARLRFDCGSDHELLIAKFRLKLKKVGKPQSLLGMA